MPTLQAAQTGPAATTGGYDRVLILAPGVAEGVDGHFGSSSMGTMKPQCLSLNFPSLNKKLSCGVGT
jgi:hypothetical protein